jgi:hypothetical protein
MRRFRWTGFAAVLALLIALGSVAAQASPGGAQSSATLRFELAMDGAVAQPFDRWLQELAGLAALTIESETWKDGEAMTLRLSMGASEAWTISLLAEPTRVSMACSMMAEGVVTLREEDALEARALMAALRAAAGGPAKQRMTAGQFAEMLRGAAVTTRRWGVAAKGTEGETCTAMADFLDDFAGIAEKQGGQDWLTIQVEPVEPDPLSLSPGATEAPEELPGVLAMEAFWSTMRAIAAE